ncbi:PREDICTED: CWF19-like protein 2 [Vollenhovia emeryi]|uniref:CWF19-like protein 2 n=1 Tax=Vollenhovia emeryi TaxID=411798 RepID=UPI0005F52795|nr:PREDICTED: CWF19-like protein 2 [Vollenhovia emeryi]XP_011874813.1 PREDICTED: CWF19-like protein 2 [Vollenhovia emeryi]
MDHHVDACKTDKVKAEDIGLCVGRKWSKKSKTKRRKVKKEKKHKKKRKCSSSSSGSDDSDRLEWVERGGKDEVSSRTAENHVDAKVQESKVKRDEWMNVESFVPHLSNAELQVSRSVTRKDRAEAEVFPDKPGQSGRELNPHWKDGGDGLPRNHPEKSDKARILDANWLKKSLRRAEEQAVRDGKTLEEVAAERWGSLEAILAMISQAEGMSDAKRSKSYCKSKRLHDDRDDRDAYRISSQRPRRSSRSRSRSRDRAEKRDTSDYSSQRRAGLKRTCQRPKDNDDYYHQALPAVSRTKNWKKYKNDDKVVELPASAPRQVDLGSINSATDEDDGVAGASAVLTEAEMNKLGARIVKAELMGDNELAAQLKVQLEGARKQVTTCSTSAQEDNVILVRTDAKGVARPIEPRLQPRGKSKREDSRRKKTAETHISGERVRHFVDDDKYSLREMFQREKGRSTNEDEAIFTKITRKGMAHMDDIFEQQITQTDSEARQDELDRKQAIKEHKNLSKFMDNCWWCLDSKNMLKHMVVAMDSAICLSLPACTSLSAGHCILTPVQHVACQLQLDEDVWDRLKEFKGKLVKMFMEEGLYPIFFEVYKRRCKFSHMQLECIPLPKEIGELGPVYFKKALLECETEWSINKKIVDLTSKGVRHAVPNGLSYFMVEFASHSGYAHVIEDEEMFPQNFAKEIIGGMLDLDHNLWRKPRKQSFEEQTMKVLEFTEKWKKHNSSGAS